MSERRAQKAGLPGCSGIRSSRRCHAAEGMFMPGHNTGYAGSGTRKEVARDGGSRWPRHPVRALISAEYLVEVEATAVIE